MPIDASIYDTLQGPQPLAQREQQAAVYETARLQRDTIRQKKQDDAAMRRAVQEAQGDPDKAVEALMRGGFASAASSLQETIDKSRTAAAARKKTQLETDEKQWQQLSQSASLVTPQNYGQWRQMVSETDPRLVALLGESYDPAGMEKFSQLMLAAKDRMDDERAKTLAVLQAETTRRGQDMTQETAFRGQDTTAATAEAGQAVTMRGQDIGADTAKSGQAVTMRGQDIGASTARRGQDIGAATTRRGQDLTDARAKLDAAGTMMPQDAPLVESIIKNPKAYSDLTPTVKTRLIPALSARGFDFGKADVKGGPDVGKIMNEIGTLSRKINTQAGGVTAVGMGYLRRGQAAAGYDNDVAEYEALVNGMIPMVARANGHTGVLTQQDVDSTRELFPQLTDNKTLAANKLARVNRLIQGGSSAAAPGAADPLGIRGGR